MIKLLGNLYLDYSFTGASVADSNERVIYINELGKAVFDEATKPLAAYPDLTTALSTTGGLEALLQIGLQEAPQPAYLILDAPALNELLVRYYRALYPNMSQAMVHRLIKYTVADQKYTQSSWPGRLRTTRESLLRLTIPTPAQTAVWWRRTEDQVPFSTALRELVGEEFLLAHALAVDFDETDPHVQRLTARFNEFFWRSLVSDYRKRKRKLVMGVFGWKEKFGLSIDPLAEDFDTQLAAVQDELLPPLDEDVADLSPGQVVRSARTVALVKDGVLRINRLNQIGDTFKEALVEHYISDETLSTVELKNLVDSDRARGWSNLFRRNKVHRGINSLLIGFLMASRPEALREFILE